MSYVQTTASSWFRSARLHVSCALLLMVANALTASAQEVAAEASSGTDAASRAPEVAALSARVLVGAGVSQRTIALPSNEGWRRLNTGLAPALGLGLSGSWRKSARFVGLRLSYQTGLRARVTDTVGDPGLVPSPVTVRSQHIEGGLSPGLFLSGARDAGSVSLFAGYGIRAFNSVEVLRVPRFTLHGPLLRLELALPLLRWLRVRVAPEAQLFISMSESLRSLALLPKTALSFGAEAELEVRLHPSWGLQLSYREARAAAAGIEGKRFQDIERYLLLNLAYQIE